MKQIFNKAAIAMKEKSQWKITLQDAKNEIIKINKLRRQVSRGNQERNHKEK